MTLRASLYFAKSLIFPRAEKNSTARKSLYGAVICIGLSIIPLVAVISITNGMIKGMTERIIGLSSSHLEMRVAGGIEETKTAANFEKYAASFERLDGIKTAYPEVTLSALALGKNIRSGAYIRGVQNDIFKKNESFKTLFEVIEGDTGALEAGGNTAIIGKKMAEILGLKTGDTFRIITTKKAGAAIVPKMTAFKVGAVISSGYQELDQLWVFIPLKTFFRSFSMTNADFNVLLETDDAFSPRLIALQRAVKKEAGRFANVYRWDQVNASRFENFSSTRVMLVFIMMMIVLVASINISSAIVMLVLERRREIAILKSVGASPRGISLSFMLTGLFCGFSGLCIGLPLGLLITLYSNQLIRGLESLVNLFTDLHLMDPAYYLQTIPVEIPVKELIIVCMGTLLLSLLVSVIPAVKAGKEKPLEALK